MNVITIQSEAFEKIMERLKFLETSIRKKALEEFRKEWLNGKQVMEMLNISKRTLQAYRDQGRIGFSQVGSKLYYRAGDIFDHLEKHYRKPYGRK